MNQTIVGLYGPRVIGQEQYDAEQGRVKEQSLTYGPRVLGEHHPANRAFVEALDAVQEANVALGNALGVPARKKATARVVQARRDLALARNELEAAGGKAAPQVGPNVREGRPHVMPNIPEHREGVGAAESPPPPLPPPADFGSFSIADLKGWLAGHPLATVVALDAELERENPRSGALKAILDVELAREAGARDEVVNRIAEA